MVVRSNLCKRTAARVPDAVHNLVRAQVLQTEDDVTVNVVKYDVIDTGNLLGLTKGEMTGQGQGEVVNNAEYAAYQNFGTRFIAGRPFFSDAIDVARQEFPKRFKDLERELA